MSLLHKISVPVFLLLFAACGPAVISANGNHDAEDPIEPTGGSSSPGSENDETADNETPASDDNEPATTSNGALETAPLAARLLIDGSVHTGTDWAGNPYIGVWGEAFDFDMSAYPVTWAISLVHASKLLRSRGVDYGPNAVLSVAIKESRLGCSTPDFPNDDGCFQIEGVYDPAGQVYISAYGELVNIFPERFPAMATSHDELISGGHFETSALSLVYYTLFSLEMFYLHSDDPHAFFADHPIASAQQKVISAAYNRGLWWTGLTNVFNHCAQTEVTQCFQENGAPHTIAIDHANAIADYTAGLNGAQPFDADLSLQDLKDYWSAIKPLYADADDNIALNALTSAFNAHENGSAVSFQTDLDAILNTLIAALPAAPSSQQTLAAICGKGYLWESPPCP